MGGMRKELGGFHPSDMELAGQRAAAASECGHGWGQWWKWSQGWEQCHETGLWQTKGQDQANGDKVYPTAGFREQGHH